MNHLTNAFFGLDDRDEFIQGVNAALRAVAPRARDNVFTGDNLIAFSRNLGFLDDEKFMTAVRRYAEDEIEQAIIWRTHVLIWAARVALRRAGDFVECCCYRGTSAAILADCLEFGRVDKTFWLYDAFDVHPEYQGISGTATKHGPDLFEETRARMARWPTVRVLKGTVPAVLAESPERIAFLHLDMNSAAGEEAALDALFDRITPGGMIVLDDYGYRFFQDQRDLHDRFFGERDCPIVELPTSQGLVIKL
jgi:hypothetical protein